ncbi:MAG: CapA family protein [Lachnospiraceae bacterium]|nr:CapA family protein [Lachnospiraceae bacterium]
MGKTTSFIFTGDIGFDKYMDGKWESPDFIDEKIRDFLSSADHLCVNVEGAFAKPDETAKEGVNALKHSMSPEAAFFIKDLGADIFNICNNHIMDCGEKGISDTLEIAKDLGVKTLGAGRNMDEASKPLFFEDAGGVGLLAVGYERACRKAGPDTPGCLNFSEMDIVRKRIKEIKGKCRWCIVVAHDGEEFTALPSPYTRERFHSYLEMGADIVVAHHPHVPMNYETVGEKMIFYSLGNFIFDTDYQRSQKNTERGIFIKLNLREEGYGFIPYGILIDREKGRIVPYDLPDIFEDVRDDEYEKLIPLSSKMFIENTKKQQKYLFPEKFKDATEKDWYDNFYEPLRSGRVPGKLLDMQIIYPLSLKEKEGAWKESRLEGVKRFILDQMG